MKVRALTDFGGQYAMYKGNEADLPDNPVVKGLIAGGFIAEVTEPEKQDLSKFKKEKLIKMLEEKGIEYDEKAKKEDLIKLLEGDEENLDTASDPDAEDPDTATDPDAAGNQFA